MAANTGKSKSFDLLKKIHEGDANLPMAISSEDHKPAALDFTAVLDKAVELFQDQALLSKNSKEIDLKDLSLTKAKVNSFLDAINNIISISHLNEILKQDSLKFKREQELDAMNSILSSFNLASKAAEKNMEFLVKQLDYAIKQMGNAESLSEDGVEDAEENKKRLDMVIAIQTAYGTALANLSQVTTGLTKIIQLERWSGSRPWGNIKSNTVTVNNELMGNWINPPRIGGGGNAGGNGVVAAPRKLTPMEIIGIEGQSDKDFE